MVLLVQFNPSYWMFQTGVKGARQGSNAMAGNAEALRKAL
jgi:hypothetical protein